MDKKLFKIDSNDTELFNNLKNKDIAKTFASLLKINDFDIIKSLQKEKENFIENNTLNKFAFTYDRFISYKESITNDIGITQLNIFFRIISNKYINEYKPIFTINFYNELYDNINFEFEELTLDTYYEKFKMGRNIENLVKYNNERLVSFNDEKLYRTNSIMISQEKNLFLNMSYEGIKQLLNIIVLDKNLNL